MERKHYEKRRCIFCGQVRTITIIEDDGYDYLGHHRGASERYEDDDGCNCSLGRLVGKAEIVPMCLNCEFYDRGYCTNRKKIEAISDMFAIGDKVRVKKTEHKCKEYKLNPNIFKALIKDRCE